MRRSFIRIFPVLLLTLLAISLPVGFVAAQGECETLIVEADDVAIEEGEMFLEAGSFYTVTVTGVFRFHVPGGGNPTPTDGDALYYTTDSWATQQHDSDFQLAMWDSPLPLQSYNPAHEYVWEGIEGQNAHAWFKITDDAYGDNDGSLTVEVCNEDDTPPGGGLTMPLASEDLHAEWGMYDDEYVHELDEDWPEDEENRLPVYAYTKNIEASVHAVQGGTVTAVDYDITTDCQTLAEAGVPFGPQACFVVVPGVIRSEPGPQLFTVNMAKTARIIVRTGEDDEIIYNYFVSNPSVAVGDELEPGCIIGQVMEMHNPPVDLGDIDIGGQIGSDGLTGDVEVDGVFGTIQTGLGVTVVRRSFLLDIEDPEVEIVPLLPDLTEEPDESACDGNTSGCVNDNSSLLTLNKWSTSNGVDLIDGGGVSLPGGNGGSQIYQSGLVLDDETNYTLTVSARSTTAGDGFTVVNKIRLFVGTEISEEGITTTFDTFSLDFVGEELGADQAFGVVNRNALGTDIEVRYICISEEGTQQLTNACYFRNHHFDDGPTQWTVTPGITFTDGQAFTYDESIIEQYAVLDPLSEIDPADYRITVAGRLLATSAYTGQSGKYIGIYYKYPSTESYVLIDEVDAAMVAAEGLSVYSGGVDIEHLYVLTAELEITEHENSLFSIQTIVEDSDSYLRGFRIDYICLQSISTDDGSFPGQDNPGGFVPPFYTNCQVINTPQDNNISSWTYYHWQNLRRFFDCTLMVRLNQMSESMDSMFRTGRLFMRWVIASNQMAGRWLSTQFMPWLNGSFNNIALGAGNTVSGIGDNVDTSANVFGDIINGVKTVAAAAKSMVDALQNLLSQFVNFYNFVSALVNALVTAYSAAEAIPIPNLPTCTIATDEHIMCVAFWIVDNTILSGPGAALIPIILSFGTTHLLLWLIIEFKRNVLSQGQAL